MDVDVDVDDTAGFYSLYYSHQVRWFIATDRTDRK